MLDTSVVVEALFPNQPLRSACGRLFERCAEEGATVFFNRLLVTELQEAAFKLALRERYGRNARRSRYDGRARRRAGRLLSEVSDAWSEVLSVLDWGMVELEEVAHLVPDLMCGYGLASFDATHVATATSLGVKAIATIDHGFAAVHPDVADLWVPSVRLRSFRQYRSRHRNTPSG